MVCFIFVEFSLFCFYISRRFWLGVFWVCLFFLVSLWLLVYILFGNYFFFFSLGRFGLVVRLVCLFYFL